MTSSSKEAPLFLFVDQSLTNPRSSFVDRRWSGGDRRSLIVFVVVDRRRRPRRRPRRRRRRRRRTSSKVGLRRGRS